MIGKMRVSPRSRSERRARAPIHDLYGPRGAWLVMVAVAWMAAGCILPSTVDCGEGLACPANTRCDVANNRCVTGAADAACAGHAEGDSCILAGALGTCIAGACAPATFEWKESAALAHPSARADHAMATLGDEVVLFGGEVSVGSVPYLADTWQWDGRLWSELAPAARPPVPRCPGTRRWDRG